MLGEGEGEGGGPAGRGTELCAKHGSTQKQNNKTRTGRGKDTGTSRESRHALCGKLYVRSAYLREKTEPSVVVLFGFHAVFVILSGAVF